MSEPNCEKLASFSQFGSDIDKETKERLDHGQVLMEVIKQRQYSPVRVEHQVMIFYAAVGKHLDDINTSGLAAFEKGLFEHMDAMHPSVSKGIRETGALSSEAEEELKKGIEEYKKEFLRTEQKG